MKKSIMFAVFSLLFALGLFISCASSSEEANNGEVKPAVTPEVKSESVKPVMDENMVRIFWEKATELTVILINENNYQGDADTQTDIYNNVAKELGWADYAEFNVEGEKWNKEKFDELNGQCMHKHAVDVQQAMINKSMSE